MEQFRSLDEIQVELVGTISQPYELAVASARTCYSGRGIIYPDEVSTDEKAQTLRDRIASSTLEAGHLTTRQHAHFVFAISGVSRHFIWSFLHSHPFYNSEQVSQRYVRVKRGAFLMPSLASERARRRFHEAADRQMADYEALIAALRQPLTEEFYERFPARRKTHERWQASIDKRALEVARYVLGLGTTAYLYHTVSALTLLRYGRLMHSFDVPTEQRLVVEKMLNLVRATDPLFEKEIQDPVPLEETPEYHAIQFRPTRASDEFIREFDGKLEGRAAKLVAYSNEAEQTLIQAFRVALGRTVSELSDDEALRLLLDPQANPQLADTLNLQTMSKFGQVLRHVTFTFIKKLSHTADSQDQRHRSVYASRPLLYAHYSGRPDYISPFATTRGGEVEDLFRSSMERSFSAVNELLDEGVPAEQAFYLLPNAFSIRMVSTGDLQSLHHKWKLRTCYNAQEEIFRSSVEEIRQVAQVCPRLTEHLRAPCYLRLRAGTKPYCPEGDRFCGVPVWKQDLSLYNRKSL